MSILVYQFNDDDENEDVNHDVDDEGQDDNDNDDDYDGARHIRCFVRRCGQ